MLVLLYRATWRHIRDDSNLNTIFIIMRNRNITNLNNGPGFLRIDFLWVNYFILCCCHAHLTSCKYFREYRLQKNDKRELKALTYSDLYKQYNVILTQVFKLSGAGTEPYTVWKPKTSHSERVLDGTTRRQCCSRHCSFELCWKHICIIDSVHILWSRDLLRQL